MAASLTVKHCKSTQRPASWCSCPNARSSIQRQNASLPNSRYHPPYAGHSGEADQTVVEKEDGHDQGTGIQQDENGRQLEGCLIGLPLSSECHEEGEKVVIACRGGRRQP